MDSKVVGALPEHYGIPKLPQGDYTIDAYDTTRDVTGKDQLASDPKSKTEETDTEDLIKREGNSIVVKFAAVRDE